MGCGDWTYLAAPENRDRISAGVVENGPVQKTLPNCPVTESKQTGGFPLLAIFKKSTKKQKVSI